MYSLILIDMKLEEIDWRAGVEKMCTLRPQGFANMNLPTQRRHNFVILYLVNLFTVMLFGLLVKGELEHSIMCVRSSGTWVRQDWHKTFALRR